MIKYINSLEKSQLKKLCVELAKTCTRLGLDGDVVYREYEDFDTWDEPQEEGFYCVHSGEPC